MEDVLLHIQDGIAEVTLNRPAQKNAITGPFGQALAAQINNANDDPEVRVVLLKGAEGAFCSGLDLKAFNADPAPDWLPNFQHIWRQAHAALYNCNKPIVCAMERYAINCGAALALACDLLVVGRRSFIQVGEAQIGMAAPYNLAWLSLRHSENLVARIALLGERLNGDDLEALQIAHSVVEDDQVLPTAQALATQLAGYPESGLPSIKAGLRAHVNMDADAWFDQFTQQDPVGAAPKPSSMKR